MTTALEAGKWSAARPGKDPVPIVQEAGWAPGPVWKGGKSRPTGIRSPDRPARSQSLILAEAPPQIVYASSPTKPGSAPVCIEEYIRVYLH
jgi:hypothetical protein